MKPTRRGETERYRQICAWSWVPDSDGDLIVERPVLALPGRTVMQAVVLINAETPRKDAIRTLKKVLAGLEQEPGPLSGDDQCYPPCTGDASVCGYHETSGCSGDGAD